MKFVVQLFIERGDGAESVVAVTEFQRDGSLQGAQLGMTLAESKALLEATQHGMVEQQFKAYWQAERT